MNRGLAVVAIAQTVVIGTLIVLWPRGASEVPGVASDAAGPRGVAPELAPREASGTGQAASLPAVTTGGARERVASGDEAWRVDDPVGLVLFGTATGKDGAAVEQGRVWLSRGKRNETFGGELKAGKGWFVAGLEPGTWKLTTRAEGFKPLEKTVELGATPRMTRLDLVLEKSYLIKVKLLTPDDKPLLPALYEAAQRREFGTWPEVVAVATESPLPAFLEDTDARELQRGFGEWRGNHDMGRDDRPPLPKEYAGTLELRVPPPVHVSAVLNQLVLASALVAAGQDEVTLRIDIDALKKQLVTVRVQFVSAETGKPISQLHVSLMPLSMGGGGQPTDAEGRMVFAGHTPGWERLSAMHQEYEWFDRKLLLEPKPEQDLGTIRLASAVTINGLVVDPAGRPVSGRLRCINLERFDPADAEYRGNYQVNAEGEIDCRGLGRGRYLLLMADDKAGLAGWRVLDTTAGAIEGTRLQLQTSAVVKVVSRNDKERWNVLLRAPDGTPLWSLRTYAAEHELRVPPGNYTVDIHHNRRLQRSVPLVVTAAGGRVEVP